MKRLSINSSQTTAECHIGLRTFLANSHDLVDLVLSRCIRRLATRGDISNVLLVTQNHSSKPFSIRRQLYEFYTKFYHFSSFLPLNVKSLPQLIFQLPNY